MTSVRTHRASVIYGQDSGAVRALNEVSVSFSAGEFVAIVGHSGCGKSTLLNLLGLLVQPTSGAVNIEGIPSGIGTRRVRRLRTAIFGYIHQDHGLLLEESVRANVVLPLDYQPKAIVRNQRVRMVAHALDDAGVPHLAARRAGSLSGGEKKRVALARAIVRRPSVILADEPTGELDSRGAREVFDLLRDQASAGRCVVVATHNSELASTTADRIVTLRDGHVVGEVTPRRG